MGGINLSKEPMPRYCEFGVIFTRSACINLSGENEGLRNQKIICEDYAKRMNVKILQYFGGLKAAGKNNVRIEIIRMHYFLERYSFIGRVLISSPDRLEGRRKEFKDLQQRLIILDIDLNYCLPRNPRQLT